MRVTYLHQYFNTPQMPGDGRSFEMARRLAANGHQVNLLTAFRDESGNRDWFETREAGINVHWLPVPYSNTMSYAERIQSFFRFAMRSARRASQLEADVVFATSTPLTIALPGVRAARRIGAPMVFEVRDLWPELPIAMGVLRDPVSKFLARRLERFAYRNSSRIVALSPGMAKGVAATGYPRERISVIPNSCDLELLEQSDEAAEAFRQSHPELGDGPIVLYAGTLGHINGVDYLVEVAARLLEASPSVRFVILGYGAREAHVRSEAERLGVLNRNLFIYSRIPKSEMVKAFSAASIATSLFVDLPEMENNSANKFFDGLAAGKPVAINYGGWQAELLEENDAGLVLSRDPNEAANQLDDCLGDPDWLDRTGRAARALAEQRFSRDRLAAKLEQVLLDAVDQPESGAT
ncbi:glycosyltransferase family 4 protein [Wenzhouxiangella sp. EGI_FJ10409]|uniref:glycosyltransferase family 4 protein n=1 Tax=Wenzhouxiangella sp. EGI_FJ10409 TaxID=3243767 RepID=UPI0035E34512